MDKTIKELVEKARGTWEGEVGEKRANKLENYLKEKLQEYSEVLNMEKKEILTAWEDKRTYSVMNYYQDTNQPSLKGEHVKVFDTVKELHDYLRNKKYTCSSCGGESTLPNVCDSGELKENGEACNWAVNGLFRLPNESVYVYVKEEMRGTYIFKPIERGN